MMQFETSRANLAQFQIRIGLEIEQLSYFEALSDIHNWSTSSAPIPSYAHPPPTTNIAILLHTFRRPARRQASAHFIDAA